MRNRSRSFLGDCLGGRLCVHIYRTLTVTVLYSLYSINDVSQISSATISKRPFHELEFLVGGGWVCKPILVIDFARNKPQADQIQQLHGLGYFNILMLLLLCKYQKQLKLIKHLFPFILKVFVRILAIKYFQTFQYLIHTNKMDRYRAKQEHRN